MDETTIWLIIVIGFVAGLAIIYFLIYFATKAANHDLLRATRIFVNLKAIELKKQGLEVKEAKEHVDEIERLKKARYESRITPQQLKEKLDDYLI